MNGLPTHLLEALASKDEQVRYISGATKEEYLLPEELLNDAYHFCERAKQPQSWSQLSSLQRLAVESLLLEMKALPDATLTSATIVDDLPWIAIRQRAADVLTLFGPTALA